MGSVGFIGLGNMGRHMAANFLKSGRQLIVFDVTSEPMAALKKIGAKIAANPAELAERCSEIITMLPTHIEIEDAFWNPNGILKKAAPGTLCINCSTVAPTFEKQMSEQMSEKGIDYIDAPVSGGVVAAKKSTLTFMVGGKTGSFLRAKPILRLMGRSTVHCGKVGNGQATKICNNLLLCIQMLGVSEAMNLGIRFGLDAANLTSVINQSTGRCFASEVNNPVPGVIEGAPSSKQYQGGFKCHLAAKDLRLAQFLASETSTPIPVGSVTHQIFRLMANSKKYMDLDFSSIFKFLEVGN